MQQHRYHMISCGFPVHIKQVKWQVVHLGKVSGWQIDASVNQWSWEKRGPIVRVLIPQFDVISVEDVCVVWNETPRESQTSQLPGSSLLYLYSSRCSFQAAQFASPHFPTSLSSCGTFTFHHRDHRAWGYHEGLFPAISIKGSASFHFGPDFKHPPPWLVRMALTGPELIFTSNYAVSLDKASILKASKSSM